MEKGNNIIKKLLLLFFLFLSVNAFAGIRDFKHPFPGAVMTNGYDSNGHHPGMDFSSGVLDDISSSSFGIITEFDDSNAENTKVVLFNPTRCYNRDDIDIRGNVIAGSRQDWGGYNYIYTKHLINTGDFVYLKYLHFEQNSIPNYLVEGQYIAKGQYIGKEGESGCVTAEHLHFEVGISQDPQRYNITGITNTYNPDDFISNHTYKVAIPLLSRSEDSLSTYDVYGIANRKIYSKLNLSGTFYRASTVVRSHDSRRHVNQRVPDSDSTKDGLSDEQRLLGGKNENSPVNGISGEVKYDAGDYLFVAWVIDEKGNEAKYGYPVKFSILNENEFIIDNDQTNADNDATNDSGKEFTYNGSEGGSKIPGYFLTAELHEGRSGRSAQWKPYKKDKYQIYVHIPEHGPTATSVQYAIKADGKDTVFSQPINQSTNLGEWVQIKAGDNGEIDSFDFNESGYIGIYLGRNSDESNYNVTATQKVAFDAMKFVILNEPEKKQIDSFYIDFQLEILQKEIQTSHYGALNIDHDLDLFANFAGGEFSIDFYRHGGQKTFATESHRLFQHPSSSSRNPKKPFTNSLKSGGMTAQPLFRAGSRDRQGEVAFAKPSAPATRGETLLLSMLVHGDAFRQGLESHYNDVPKSHPLYDVIETATSLGIVRGYDGSDTGYFKPDNTVSRIEALGIVFKTFGLKLLEDTDKGPRGRTWSNSIFPDIRVSHWSYPYIKSAYLYEIMDGFPDGTFGPDEKLSRSQLVKIVHQAMQLSRIDFITAGHYREPVSEDYSDANNAPSGTITVDELGSGRYRLRANFSDSDSQDLSYYWVAKDGSFHNLTPDESEVEWQAPINAPNGSTHTIQVWVHDGHGKMAIEERELIVTSDVEITCLILTQDNHEATIRSGSYVRVYGSGGADILHIESGARVECFHMVGESKIYIDENSDGFKILRSGATVIFTNPDTGTFLKLPAGLETRKIIFNDIEKPLDIKDDKVVLDKRQIDLTVPVPGSLKTWYQDADGDGYGNPAKTIEAVFQPDGYVVDNTDCDDNDPSVHDGCSAVSGSVPDTGQTKCYDEDGNEITCPSPGEEYYGQDGCYSINPPSYTKLDSQGNLLPDSASSWAMVKDNVTGLIWEVKTESNKNDEYTWYEAKEFVKSLNDNRFGGFSDWRLPTIKELVSIVDYSISYPGPTIKTAYFPRTAESDYWSGTTNAHDTDDAWGVDFNSGYDYTTDKSNANSPVRAVRSGQ